MPLVNVPVEIYDAAGHDILMITTDSSGAYVTAGGVAPGTYYARTHAPGYINEAYDDVVCVPCSPTTSTPILVTAGEVRTHVDFALSPGAKFTGSVTDAAGLPIGGHVNLNDSTGRHLGYTFVNAEGDYTTPRSSSRHLLRASLC